MTRPVQTPCPGPTPTDQVGDQLPVDMQEVLARVLRALPLPLNALVPDLVGAAEHFRLNAPSHLRTLLEQCTGLAQTLSLAATECDFMDHTHRAALVQTSNLLAEYTRFTCALYAALDE